MTIAFDAGTDLGNGTGTLSATHTPVGTPAAVIVFVMQNAGQTDEVTGVTYGGVAMTGNDASDPVDTIGEPGRCYCYTLFASIPTGAQTVTVSVSATGSAKVAGCITVTASGTVQHAGNSPQSLSNNVADPQITITGISGASWGCAGIYTGANAVSTPGANSGFSDVLEHDFGATCAAVIRDDAEQASGDLTIGWTMLSDDVAMWAVALEEVVAAGDPSVGSIFYSTIFGGTPKNIFREN